jgi:uncharacterized protein
MASQFIWYELMTTDTGAAAAFYGGVLGWIANEAGPAANGYRILTMNGIAVGGLMTLPAEAAKAGMRPLWLGYIGVPDVDKSSASIVAASGAVCMPATDIPAVGRIAMLADPQGAAFYVMTPTGSGPATSFAPGKPGHGAWHELHARDGAAALGFYCGQFGWTKAQEMDMGPMGIYYLFNDGSGERLGGMMGDAQAPRPFWLYYFCVEDIDPAHRRVTANGGAVLRGPHQVPTGEWIIQAQDPQGAPFALVGPRIQVPRS